MKKYMKMIKEYYNEKHVEHPSYIYYIAHSTPVYICSILSASLAISFLVLASGASSIIDLS